MAKILVVEDDEAMAAALREGLTGEGYAVEVARDGPQGLKMAADSAPDLVILDVMLPKMSGLDVCRRIRAGRKDVPIIMLTARGQEIDKVVGLRAGADDYVTKPFAFMELVARVEAVLRRTPGTRKGPDACAFGDVEVDFKRFTARKGGQPLKLTPREFRLLSYFLARRGEVLGREDLLTSVWGYERGTSSRTVDIHILKLRRKIEDHPDNPRFILTVHGAGYRFSDG